MRGVKIGFPAYEIYDTSRLIDAYAAGPARIGAALDGLTEDELRRRARGPAKWSAHEIAIHVCDSELQGVFRMRKIWAESGADLPGYDQDSWARELDYLGRDGAADRERALGLFAQLRTCGLTLLHRAGGSEWKRWGTHPDYGRVTLRNMLELYADHSERHVEQILAIRELLGKSLEMPSLLPQRLY